MARPSCQLPACPAGAGGRCLEGFPSALDCPHAAPSSPSRAADGGPEPGAWFELPEGTDLDSRAVERITRTAVTRVVIVGGAADSGKTTLLTALYERFQRGPLAGYLFAGSETLLGFERRCYLGRVECGRATADTARTSVSATPRWLHLRVRARESDAPPRNLVFCEIGGDFVRMARDSTEECRRLTISHRADHFAVLIDGAKLAQPRSRLTAANDAAMLLRGFLDAEMLGRRSFVDVIFTKWDHVAASADLGEIEQFLGAFTERTAAYCASRLGRLRFCRLSARPQPGTPPGDVDGLADLVTSWIQDSPFFTAPAPAVLRMPAELSEFDRYLWRHAALVGAATHA